MKKEHILNKVFNRVKPRKISIHIYQSDLDEDLLIGDFNIDNNFDVQTVPSTFRLNNSKRIDKLSKILEDIGLEIVKLDHSEIDRNTYLIYCHPMSNEVN